jgi:hypothetical protein
MLPAIMAAAAKVVARVVVAVAVPADAAEIVVAVVAAAHGGRNDRIIREETGDRDVPHRFWRGSLHLACDAIEERALTGRPHGSILPLLVPRHLDSFELGFVGRFGVVDERRQFGYVTIEIGEANLQRIQLGKFVRQRNRDIFRVGPSQLSSHRILTPSALPPDLKGHGFSRAVRSARELAFRP